MTAVIGIINKHSAAIAADSAVTIAGQRGAKIFNRANKIFRLSQKKPVGLMLYNNGDFMGTPWEVIIKEFRDELNTLSFQTLEEYKLHFITYLHSKSFFCNAQQQKKILHHFILTFLGNIWKEVYQENQNNLATWGSNAGKNLGLAVENRIRNRLLSLENNKEFCSEFIDFEFSEFEALGYTGLQQALNQNFILKGIPIQDTILPELKRAIYLLLKATQFNSFFSGLVFTGFGDSEIFPSILPIKVSIAVNNRLRWHNDIKNNGIITHDMSSAIRPFAQTDVIDTILSGIDPGLFNIFTQQFQNFIVSNNEQIARLIDQFNATLGNNIRGIDVSKIIQPFITSVNTEIKKSYITPMMGAINTLSKEDLAEMAESLIYLTYLKRRFTNSEESVGGPVDVAIITKGDGFIWIKRKHYFRPELNTHFFKSHYE